MLRTIAIMAITALTAFAMPAQAGMDAGWAAYDAGDHARRPCAHFDHWPSREARGRQ